MAPQREPDPAGRYGRGMSEAIVVVTGGSRGIGRALLATVPFPADLVDVSRSGPAHTGVEHVRADLADPSAWGRVGAWLGDRLAGFRGNRVTLLHCAGVLAPIGFAGEIDGDAYTDQVLVNAAAPQVLGHHFLAAVRHLDVRRELVVMTSGAASSVYEGWSGYGAGKAAVDQWVRDVAAEQRRRGGVRVHAISPGAVATGMQEQIRAADPSDFPARPKFDELHAAGQLRDPSEVARRVWAVLDRGLDDPVVDLRDLAGER